MARREVVICDICSKPDASPLASTRVDLCASCRHVHEELVTVIARAEKNHNDAMSKMLSARAQEERRQQDTRREISLRLDAENPSRFQQYRAFEAELHND